MTKFLYFLNLKQFLEIIAEIIKNIVCIPIANDQFLLIETP